MKRFSLWLSVTCLFVIGCLPPILDERMVEVDGHHMRVQTSGLMTRETGTPVVVFEAGFMRDGISAWGSIVRGVAEFAPFVAYDRAGIGRSEPDGERPTPQHIAENLHALLGVLGVELPYVLVGHSLGGPLIRMYTALYPDEVAGLLDIDPAPTYSAQISFVRDAAGDVIELAHHQNGRNIRWNRVP
jgi:pimeloyl-ACP methyl ester carboxylesterase